VVGTLSDSHFNTSITSLVSNSANSDYDSMIQSCHSHLTPQLIQQPQRKSTVSILPLTLRNIKTTRRAIKPEIIPKGFKNNVTISFCSNRNPTTTTTTTPTDKLAKLTSLKQKSFVNELFARSSSVSLERQASYESYLHPQNQQAYLTNSNRRIINQFKPPLVFNWPNFPISITTTTHPLIHSHTHHQSSSSSGVSTKLILIKLILAIKLVKLNVKIMNAI
jgi:hypothetical protein